VGSEAGEGGYSDAREATDEEREFHAQMSNGNRSENRESQGPADSGSSEPRESSSEAQREPQREPQRETPRETSRESHGESTQAPLDLPPPPPTKPFVVWSSSPTSPGSGPRRDE
jgi:hypothetical protein